ncbi:MAG: hypothetical protein HOL80_04385 [Candidatus Magasanikbacteria bacterium]|jgi:glucose/mannose-6-phosphate isomerase|nr:hypothetical protein [Candidatus Magasanikbacteria bacterium]MBT5263100.1 hypothetical protein [Candidatus Magasanikbacteria bacterium]MBT5820121.1 hypothetical protein [Candidatus Magasanikbacteria bacterium]MBT6294581.1 hypothetical protein [Candidatus Magasanikbacteria bacterium]
MEQAILDFAKQFAYEPTVEHSETLKTYTSFLLTGMGGSHLAADIVKNILPEIDLTIHHDYGVAPVSKEKSAQSLFIASSYSGNTEEVVEGYRQAKAAGTAIAVLATGGTLIALAKADGTPYIQIPDTGIQPRSALGFSLLALLKIMKQDALLSQIQQLQHLLDPASLQKQGEEIASKLEEKTPIIYASQKNLSIAYNWKIKCNETGKIPAFYNTIPELNHNEMNGFDLQENSRHLAKQFCVILLSDDTDHPQNIKRMQVVKELYEARGITTMEIPLSGATSEEKIFTSILTADWVAITLAKHYGHEAEQVPMIEEFKQKIT